MYLDKRLLQLTRGVRTRIGLAACLGLCAVGAGVARLAFSGVVIAGVLTGRPFRSLLPYLLAIAGLIGLRVVFQYLRDCVSQETAARVKVRLRGRLYEHAVAVGPGQLDQQRTGDLLLSVGEGVERLQVFFGQFLPQMAVAAIAPILIFFLMVSFDLGIGLIFLGFAVFTLVGPALFFVLNESSSRQRRTAYGALGADFLDSVQGIATLKIFGQSRAQGERLAVRARRLYRTTMSVLAVNMVSTGVGTFGILGGTACALGWGAMRVSAGDLELRSLIVILLMGTEIFRPLRELIILYHQGIVATAAAQGIFDLLDIPVSVADPVPPQPGKASIAPEIRFRNVSFAYQKGQRPALREVSFDLHQGEKLGVVGSSGAGKSTLVSLMLRFADPQEGSILLGARDIRTIPLSILRQKIAVVAQDMYIFYGTIAENLRIAKPGATDAELEQAARAANIHEFIRELPQGYDTVVGERGLRLSGGERQRIAIARAILKDAPILVLDEALSSVDARNEAAINEALDELMRGRTTLIIAHRLSSVIHADRIMVLEKGKVVESGTHSVLLENGGTYARLMAAQAGPDLVRNVTEDLEAGKPPVVPVEAAPEAGQQSATRQPQSDRGNQLSAFAVLRRLAALVRPFGRKLGVSFSAGVLYQASLVGVGVASALVVAQLIRGEAVQGYLVLLGFMVVASSALSWAEIWLAHDLAYRLLAEMRIDMYDTIDPLAPAYLLRRRSGDLVGIVGADVEMVELFFAHTITPAFIAVVVPVAILIALSFIAWPLALTLCPFLVIVALSPFLAQRRSEELGSVVRREMGKLNAHIVDSIQGLREVIAFSFEKRQTADLLTNSWRVARSQTAFQRDQALQAGVNEGLTGIGALAVLTTGVWLVAQSEMARALLPLASVLALGAFGPVTEIARTFKELMETLASARRVFEVKDEPVPVRDGPGVRGERSGSLEPPRIQFENVSFSYGPNQGFALRDLSFAIEPGHTLALVGPSGAGKTTCAHLLLRFWDPTAGRIQLGEHDIREYRLEDLRSRISLVSQDTYLFNTSIRDNLKLARPDATREEIEEAARLANVHDFLSRLPAGYDTVVGERGLQLSGGQRQRIAIARAILKNAPILILDEATSHLDAINEQLIHQALSHLVRGRTTLVIAHRLSTIREADHIVVMDSGRIVEQGDHDLLLEQNGLYAHLVMTQLIGAGQPEPGIDAGARA